MGQECILTPARVLYIYISKWKYKEYLSSLVSTYLSYEGLYSNQTTKDICMKIRRYGGTARVIHQRITSNEGPGLGN